MALNITDGDKKMPKIIAGKTVFVNADKSQVVEEDSPQAAFLVAREGAAVTEEELKQYGLTMKDVDGKEEDTRTEEEKEAAKQSKAKSSAKSAEQTAEEETGDEEDLEGMTKEELKALADERGVEVKSSMTKAELIEAIEAAEE